MIPSLPGYGFSSDWAGGSAGGSAGDFTLHDVSALLHNLLTTNLPFRSTGYIASGGDTGSVISRILAVKYLECKALLINFCNMPITPEREVSVPLTEKEREGVERGKEFLATGSAYAALAGTRPATLGLTLAASPLSLLAFVAEKFLSWSDPATRTRLPEILSSVSFYWYTNTIARSFYHYRHLLPHDDPKLLIPADKVFGYQYFPKEINPMPQAWAASTAETGKLVWFREHERGGHFAAMEEPEECWRDLDEFMEVVKKKGGDFGA